MDNEAAPSQDEINPLVGARPARAMAPVHRSLSGPARR